jgi:hypothetical protein
MKLESVKVVGSKCRALELLISKAILHCLLDWPRPLERTPEGGTCSYGLYTRTKIPINFEAMNKDHNEGIALERRLLVAGSTVALLGERQRRHHRSSFSDDQRSEGHFSWWNPPQKRQTGEAVQIEPSHLQRPGKDWLLNRTKPEITTMIVNSWIACAWQSLSVTSDTAGSWNAQTGNHLVWNGNDLNDQWIRENNKWSREIRRCENPVTIYFKCQLSWELEKFEAIIARWNGQRLECSKKWGNFSHGMRCWFSQDQAISRVSSVA